MEKRINNNSGITVHLDEHHNYDIQVDRRGVQVYINHSHYVHSNEWEQRDIQLSPTKTHQELIIARLLQQKNIIDEVIGLLREEQ